MVHYFVIGFVVCFLLGSFLYGQYIPIFTKKGLPLLFFVLSASIFVYLYTWVIAYEREGIVIPGWMIWVGVLAYVAMPASLAIGISPAFSA